MKYLLEMYPCEFICLSKYERNWKLDKPLHLLPCITTALESAEMVFSFTTCRHETQREEKHPPTALCVNFNSNLLGQFYLAPGVNRGGSTDKAQYYVIRRILCCNCDVCTPSESSKRTVTMTFVPPMISNNIQLCPIPTTFLIHTWGGGRCLL